MIIPSEELLAGRFGGMRVIVHKPMLAEVHRGWRERLLSWPWRPWKGTKLKWLESSLQPDDCYIINGELHCGERAYDAIRRQVALDK